MEKERMIEVVESILVNDTLCRGCEKFGPMYENGFNCETCMEIVGVEILKMLKGENKNGKR